MPSKKSNRGTSGQPRNQGSANVSSRTTRTEDTHAPWRTPTSASNVATAGAFPSVTANYSSQKDTAAVDHPPNETSLVVHRSWKPRINRPPGLTALEWSNRLGNPFWNLFATLQVMPTYNPAGIRGLTDLEQKLARLRLASVAQFHGVGYFRRYRVLFDRCAHEYARHLSEQPSNGIALQSVYRWVLGLELPPFEGFHECPVTEEQVLDTMECIINAYSHVLPDMTALNVTKTKAEGDD